MKDQVTTIEQSKKLIELGVPAEKASLIYTTITDARGTEYQTVMERDLVLPENIEGYAFTVADLMNLLPPEIERYELCIYYTNFVWWAAYRNTKYIIPYLSAKYADTIIESVFNMVKHLVVNKYKLNV